MIRRGGWLACAVLVAGLALLAPWCAQAKPKAQHKRAKPAAAPVAKAEPAPAPAPAPDPNDPAAAPRIVLAKNLRLAIRPTLLGLVPPEEADGYGQAFIRVLDPTPGALLVHYEVKELVDSQDGAIREWWQAPLAKPEPLTRIRRGEITVAGLAAARAMLSPLLWPEGGFTTQSSLVWLPQDCYRELAASGSTQFDGHCAADAPAPEAELLARLVAERRKQAGLAEGEPLRLELVRRAGYPCAVNGTRLRLPAIIARDTAGLAEYWILDDADNPLVLKLSYLPSANTEETPADQPATVAPGGPDPRRPKLKIGRAIASKDNPTGAVAEAGPGRGMASLVNEGGGYAVTNIDF
jgi:hypothetical protein